MMRVLGPQYPDVKASIQIKGYTTGENYIIHVCYECDPDQSPNGKPIDTKGKLAETFSGKWVCGTYMI